MPAVRTDLRIPWYRSPVSRDMLTELNQRSDLKGLVQSGGHLGLLALTAAASWFAAYHLPVVVFLLVLYVHGACWAFLLNGFHELAHKTVFKTKALNTIFLNIVSFLSWYSPVLFWASHQEHHKYTLHPPADLEVVLPARLTLADFLKVLLVNPWDFWKRLKEYVRWSLGRVEGEWESYLFPPSALKERRALFNWARFHLLGHLAIVLVAVYFKLWLVPVLVTLAPFYAGGLQWLCNNTQHTGLMDNVSDYRLCCRTILLNPFLRFIYWNMNYHTEHHMYAAVPCYNLGKLHRAISADLPHCPAGLVESWKGIIEILRKQEVDPAFEYVAELPASQAGQVRAASAESAPSL